MPNAQSITHDPGTRLQALALAEYGIPFATISALTRLSSQSIYRLKKLARERGFDPAVCTQLKLEYVLDRPKSGRPAKVTEEVERAILEEVRRGREKGAEVTSGRVGEGVGVSGTTVLKVLGKNRVRLPTAGERNRVAKVRRDERAGGGE